MLDQAMWRLDEDEWQPTEELLRVDNFVRKQLKLVPRGGKMAHPWTDTTGAPTAARLELKFVIHSGVEVTGPSLALEDPQTWAISLNGLPAAL